MLLSIFALLAASGDHAHLHPADADLYVCGPEIQETIAATQEVCLWRLMNDPEIVALVGGEIELPGSLLSVGETAGLDEEAFALITKNLKAASFSVSGLDEFEAVPEMIGITPEGMLSVLFEHEGLVILEFGTAEAARGITALSKAITSGLIVAAEASHESPVGTVKVTDYEVIPGDDTHSLWSAEWGSHIAVGFGADGASSLLTRLSGGESLGSTDHWTSGATAMKEEGGTLYMTYHHNLIGDPWYALAAADAELPMPDLLLSAADLFFGGIVPLGASEKHGNCRIVNGEYVSEVMSRSPTAAESTPPLSENFLGLVNPEAVGVWATTMDTDALAKTGHKLIAELLDLPVDVIATELEYAVGASLEEFLAPLGEGVAFYMLPISGATIPRLHAVTKLEDSAAYEAAWTQLAEFLKTQATEFVEVEDRPYRKTPVFSLKQVDGDGPATDPNSPLAAVASMGLMNPSLTVAILPDRAVFGISPSYVKREIRRLLKEDSAETALHPLAESGAPCPAGVNYFGHLDWPAVIGGIYDTVTAFLPLIADASTMPFDVDALPETETITQYFSETRVWSLPGETGTYTVKRSPVGFETGFILTATLAAAVFSIQGDVFGGEEDATDGAAPAPSVPVAERPSTIESDVARQRTRLTLQEVKLGLVIYKSENESLPDALADLLVPTEAYPRGFLNSETLPVDGWGNRLRYVTQTEDAGYRLWSPGPDGVNNDGDGDDVLSS